MKAVMELLTVYIIHSLGSGIIHWIYRILTHWRTLLVHTISLCLIEISILLVRYRPSVLWSQSNFMIIW